MQLDRSTLFLNNNERKIKKKKTRENDDARIFIKEQTLNNDYVDSNKTAVHLVI